MGSETEAPAATIFALYANLADLWRYDKLEYFAEGKKLDQKVIAEHASFYAFSVASFTEVGKVHVQYSRVPSAPAFLPKKACFIVKVLP